MTDKPWTRPGLDSRDRANAAATQIVCKNLSGIHRVDVIRESLDAHAHDIALAAAPDPRVGPLVEACEGLMATLEENMTPRYLNDCEAVRNARTALAAAKGEPAEGGG